MKKVLYISYDGMTDPLGQSQVLPYLAGLSAKGYQFTILSFEKPDRFAREKEIVQRIAQQHNITWVPLTFTSKPPVLSKIYDRWRLKQETKKLFKANRFDMIHCRSYVAAEMGLWLKKKFNTGFLFDMRGFWADEKVDSGQWRQNNFFFRRVYKHYKQKEREFLFAADGIITLTRAAKEELVSKKEYSNLQIDVIPCCADLEHFDYRRLDTAEINRIRTELNIPSSQKIITYLGSLGGWYMTNEMFDFFRQLTTKHPDYTMLLMTKDEPTHVQQQAAAMGIKPSQLVTRYSGRKELPYYIAQSDCSIFFIRPTYSKIASSPTKHAELMGMGVPVICNSIGDTGYIIDETGTGAVIKEFTQAEYNRVVEQMDNVLAIPRQKIRDAAFQYFDLEKGIADYWQIYKRILKD